MSNEFWQGFFGDGLTWSERRAMKSLSAQIHYTNENVDFRFKALGDVINEQRVAIARLRLTVKVLVDVLGEARLLEPHALKSRIDMAIEVAEQPPPAASAYRGAEAVAPARAPAPQDRCVGCRQHFARNTLNIGPEGLLCDRCFAAAGL
jgi:hypothetical protein